MQQFCELLLAGFHPGDTIIFAIGENANRVPSGVHFLARGRVQMSKTASSKDVGLLIFDIIIAKAKILLYTKPII